jgi:copper resistance protein B
MKKITTTFCALALSGTTLAGGLPDDPLLFLFKLDKAEYRNADEGDVFAWDAQAWLGKDLNKLWLKSEG